jgi:hypothetical protein
MIVLGIILLVAGYLLHIGLLATLGWIFLAIGLILLLLGLVGNGVGGRRFWY